MSNLRRPTSDLIRSFKRVRNEPGVKPLTRLRGFGTKVNPKIAGLRNDLASIHKKTKAHMGRKKYSQHLRKNHMPAVRKHL